MPDATYVREAFARIADRYVLTNHVLSLGVDVWWRKVVTSRIATWNRRIELRRELQVDGFERYRSLSTRDVHIFQANGASS